MNNGKIAQGARILLGLIFLVFGLNGFLNFIPQPPLPQEALGYMTGLMAAGYFFPLLKATEVICGALLLIGRFQSLALVILAPIALHITLFHAFLAPGGIAIALIINAAGIVLAKSRWQSFKGLFE